MAVISQGGHVGIHETHHPGGETARGKWMAHVRCSVLDPSLHTAYILVQGSTKQTPCKHCNEADHQLEDSTGSSNPPGTTGPESTHHRNYPKKASRADTTPRNKRLWNRGECLFPGTCNYSHSCALCGSMDHQAKDCATTTPAPSKAGGSRRGRRTKQGTSALSSYPVSCD